MNLEESREILSEISRRRMAGTLGVEFDPELHAETQRRLAESGPLPRALPAPARRAVRCVLYPWTWPFTVPLYFDTARSSAIHAVSRRYPAPRGGGPDMVETTTLWMTVHRRFFLVTTFGSELTISRLWSWQARLWLRRSDADLATHLRVWPDSLRPA